MPCCSSQSQPRSHTIRGRRLGIQDLAIPHQHLCHHPLSAAMATNRQEETKRRLLSHPKGVPTQIWAVKEFTNGAPPPKNMIGRLQPAWPSPPNLESSEPHQASLGRDKLQATTTH